MRRVPDLNGPSGKFLGLMGLFLVVIPGLLGAYLLARTVLLPVDGDQSGGFCTSSAGLWRVASSSC